MNFTANELISLKNLINKVQIIGQEALAVAVILQKIDGQLQMIAETEVEKNKQAKNGNEEKKTTNKK